jgi:hypothetical protein
MAGIIFAYIGAFTLWMLRGFKGNIKDLFYGKEEDDLSTHLSSSILNKIVGLIVFIIVIAIIGYIQKTKW